MPPDATEIFGAATPLAARYADLLTGPGIARGLLGPREGAVVWTRHILNCAALVPLLPDAGDVLDVGSGAGLPGLVLALARPQIPVTLLEPMARRCQFLSEAVADLALSHVAVERGRAEEVRGRIRADVVVARAVAPLRRLVPAAFPLVRPGGMLLALKGAEAADEVHQARAVLEKWKAVADISVVAVPATQTTTTVVRVVGKPR